MFSLVATERYTRPRVIPRLDSPVPDVMRYIAAVLRVEVACSLGFVRIWRIEEDTRNAMLDRHRRAANPLPVSAAYPYAPQPLGKFPHVGEKLSAPRSRGEVACDVAFARGPEVR